MSSRRSAVPDIVGCTFVLFAVALVFPVLRAPFLHHDARALALDLLGFGGLLLASLLAAVGLFLRQFVAYVLAMALSVFAVGAAVANWHMPETGQLPTAVLAGMSFVFLLVSFDEFENGKKSQSSTKPPAQQEIEA
ncbi:MAG TPA: hypothetical protein PKE31_08460 [Pseudomonadota bacterium]|nr:hypothetical protein [Pseudomonadota bacterium]